MLGISGGRDDGSGGRRAGEIDTTRISVYDNVTSSPPTSTSAAGALKSLRSPAVEKATTVKNGQRQSNGHDDSTAAALTDAERELDVILSSLYRDISWLSKTLTVVTEERDTGARCAVMSIEPIYLFN